MLDTLVLSLSQLMTPVVCSHLLYLTGFLVYLWLQTSNKKNSEGYWALGFGSVIGSLTTGLIYNPDAFTIYWTLICIALVVLCIVDNK